MARINPESDASLPHIFAAPAEKPKFHFSLPQRLYAPHQPPPDGQRDE
jgi:hypothetical protein